MHISKGFTRFFVLLILLFNPILFQKVGATKEFNVVSFDGGGTRGAATHIEMVRKWEEASGRHISKDIHMMVGTSIGGDIALYLGAGGDAQDAYDLLITQAPLILAQSYLQKMVGGVIVSRYASEPLEEQLRAMYGEKTMADIRGVYVAVTTWDTTQDEPIYLTNWDTMGESPGLPGSRGETIKLWEAARKTGAAPTYWDPYEGCTDGGVFVNNPASLAYRMGCDVLKRGVSHGILDPDADVAVVKLYSFGTGVYDGKSHHNSHLLDTNLVHQAMEMVRIGTSVVTVEKEMALGMKGRAPYYYRFTPELGQEVPLDCADVRLLGEVGRWTGESLARWRRWVEIEESLRRGPRYSFGLPDVELMPAKSAVSVKGGPLGEES